jgi:hypothetical protein
MRHPPEERRAEYVITLHILAVGGNLCALDGTNIKEGEIRTV